MTRGIVCRSCGGRTAAIARKCVHCGQEVSREGAPSDSPRQIECPGCGGETGIVGLCGVSLDVRSHCGGAWFDLAELDRFARESSDEKVREDAREVLSLTPSRRTTGATTIEYHGCPHCRQPMIRRNYKSVSGVIADSCDRHGCFLDREDLAHLLAVLSEEGLEGLEQHAKRVAIERERERVAALGEAAAAAEERARRAQLRGAWLPFYLGF